MTSYDISSCERYSKSDNWESFLRELKGGNTLNLLLRECMFIAAYDQMIEICGA